MSDVPMMEGLLLVNKPSGVTSHDVVDVVRRQVHLRRIGHTGTLDPMAQGLLILLLGSSTKRQGEFQAHDKTYEALLRLGTQTDTGDATGSVIRRAPIPTLTSPHVTAVMTSMIGPLSQIPPTFSAVKVHGRPAYWWARRHHPVTLRPRTVQLFELALGRLTCDTIDFRARCSAGTYLRSIAEVIAERLGTVGHLASLTRLRIGDWTVDQAMPLSWLADATSEQIGQRIVPLEPHHAPARRG